jgi:hypothetical protein
MDTIRDRDRGERRREAGLVDRRPAGGGRRHPDGVDVVGIGLGDRLRDLRSDRRVDVTDHAQGRGTTVADRRRERSRQNDRGPQPVLIRGATAGRQRRLAPDRDQPAALERREPARDEGLRRRPVVQVDEPQRERDPPADGVVEDEPEDRREHERHDDRHENGRPVAEPLAQILAEDDERRSNRSVAQGPAGEVQEHRLQVGLVHLDRAHRGAGLGTDAQQLGRDSPRAVDHQLDCAVLNAGGQHRIERVSAHYVRPRVASPLMPVQIDPHQVWHTHWSSQTTAPSADRRCASSSG